MMRFYISSMFMLGVVVFLFPSVKPGFAAECPVNMVPVGSICVDQYEASVWSRPPKNNGTPQGIQYGTPVGGDDYPCDDNGNDCSDLSMPDSMIFAASAPGVMPSAFITWFQAQQACANVGKRLLRNGEWQMAAAGTPDTGLSDDGSTTCNTDGLGPGAVPTGSRSACVSNWGAFDMVGNVWEWVEDWMQGNTSPWAPVPPSEAGSGYGDDRIFGINPSRSQASNSMNLPSAIIRGGFYNFRKFAGVFAMSAADAPSVPTGDLGGFRCAQ